MHSATSGSAQKDRKCAIAHTSTTSKCIFWTYVHTFNLEVFCENGALGDLLWKIGWTAGWILEYWII